MLKHIHILETFITSKMHQINFNIALFPTIFADKIFVWESFFASTTSFTLTLV